MIIEEYKKRIYDIMHFKKKNMVSDYRIISIFIMKRRIEIESLKRKTGYLVNALFCARVLRVSYERQDS